MTSNSETACESYAYPPDKRLQEALGDALIHDLFTLEKISAAQHVIDEAGNAFFRTLQPTLDQLLAALRPIEEHQENPSEDLALIKQAAARIQNQARALGFSFIQGICDHLIELCDAAELGMTVLQLRLIKHLAETLVIGFKQKIRGSGGEIGRQLLSSLHVRLK